MKERPILFGPDMVRAIHTGRKTQTRRVVKTQVPPFEAEGETWLVVGGKHYRTGTIYADQRDGSSLFPFGLDDLLLRCPYDQPGDRLWVREKFGIDFLGGHSGDGKREATYELYYGDSSSREISCFDDACEEKYIDMYNSQRGEWRPSIHMPRWASRITLEVTDVRVQRLQEISEEDAVAEGVETVGRAPEGDVLYRDYFSDGYAWSAGESFISLWHTLYGFKGPNAWSFNPWVWAVSFKVVAP